jgi:hypothetical protein
MPRIWAKEDIVGLVFWFELVATDGAVGAAQVSWFQGRSREPKTADTYFGSCGPVVVLTASGESVEARRSLAGLELAVGVFFFYRPKRFMTKKRVDRMLT